MKTEYAVILCFDAVFAEEVKRIWNHLNYNATQPHITLADFNQIDLNSFEQDFNTFFQDFQSFEVNFSSVGFFPKTTTVYLAPTITNTLWNLHQAFHDKFSKYDISPQSYYIPNHWVPHCTLKSKLASDHIQKAVNYCINQITIKKALVNRVKLIELTIDDGKVIGNRDLMIYNLI